MTEAEAFKIVRQKIKRSPKEAALALFAGVPKAATKTTILTLQKKIKNNDKVCFSYKDGKNDRGSYFDAGPAEFVLGCGPRWRFEDPESASVHPRSAKPQRVTCGNCMRSRAYKEAVGDA